MGSAIFYRVLLGVCGVFTFLSFVFAGGAHQTTKQGIPYRWGKPLVYQLDAGNLKNGVSAYDHAAVAQLIREAFSIWTGELHSAAFSFSEGEALPLAADGGGGDVNASNFSLYFNSNKELNPIVFDEDGEIFDAMFGECSKFSLFGFAGFEKVNSETAEVLKGRALFSGACIPDALGNILQKSGCGPCSLELSPEQVRMMILHEVGHLLGLDHAQVNPESYLECRRAGLCSVEHAEDLPTMFPLIYPNADLTTLHRDDIASLRRLYEDTESDTCTVSGKILAEDGKTELRGVEVVARNADPELENIDAIAFVSGAEAPRFSAFSKSRDNCTGDCGAYRITGLQPGHSYRICVQNILSEFSGSSGLEPVDPPVPLVHPACEEETFSCTCDSGDCDVFTGRDILTESFDPNADAGNFSQDQSSAGACSLTPQRFNGVWESTRLFSSKIFP